ncbi:unnamed protein product [Cylicostephanus goldi]|uniref:Uncharacterized protein n=1 Tax=Cylicostephanus goldi TaxID=71465 RepID=A0A3P6RFF4_CYLGO|nr:unnamed protein product [Cylicostephanus goldi]
MVLLGTQRDKKKKFKGKKKVKNLLEKKAKGLKLNQVDRKRLGKLEEKQKFKTQLHDSVKAELRKLQENEQENDDEIVSVNPSTPGQSIEKKASKRVSFSGMEKVKVFDKNVKDLVIKPSSASPGKGILRAKNSKVLTKKKASKPNGASSPSPKKARVDEKMDIENVETKDVEKPIVAKKKIKIQVPVQLDHFCFVLPGFPYLYTALHFFGYEEGQGAVVDNG